MHHPVPAAHQSRGVTAVFTMHNPRSAAAACSLLWNLEWEVNAIYSACRLRDHQPPGSGSTALAHICKHYSGRGPSGPHPHCFAWWSSKSGWRFELQTKVPENFTIPEKTPRTFSWLKATFTFKTLEGGLLVIVKSSWTFVWSSSDAGLPCYCHKNQTFCSLSTFEVGWSCQQPLDNDGLNTFQNIQYKTYSKLSTTTEGKSGLKVQLFNNSTKNIERKGKYGQWTMNVGLCRYWPLAIQNKL